MKGGKEEKIKTNAQVKIFNLHGRKIAVKTKDFLENKRNFTG